MRLGGGSTGGAGAGPGDSRDKVPSGGGFYARFHRIYSLAMILLVACLCCSQAPGVFPVPVCSGFVLSAVSSSRS